MQHGFNMKLMTIMGVFSIVLTLSVSLVNQHRLEKNLISGFSKENALVEDIIVTAVSDADKAFHILDNDIETEMRQYSDELLELYRKNPNVETWDYAALKQKFDGMDIYIIDEAFTIVQSSFAADIGLNFKISDGTPERFIQLLSERMQGSAFVSDGLDQETNTGRIKKYSYVPTHDHKYLIELGIYQENNPVFASFNFLETIKRLVASYGNVLDINIYTTSGTSIGKKDEEGKAILVSEANKPYFDKALREGLTQEFHRQINGEPVAYRYVPYHVQLDNVVKYTDQRMIEIVFSEQELKNNLAGNNHIFALQLLGTIALALIICYIITRLVARPMYLAFHDSLTGLSNRAAFEYALRSRIEHHKRKGKKLALLLIDLDNFKQINDTFGHEAGDIFLQEVSRRIRSAVHRAGDMTARLGGDEFAVILNDILDAKDATEIALQIIDELALPLNIQGTDVVSEFGTTASIGIAIAPDHTNDSNELFNYADMALYYAKDTTKNTYRLYTMNMADKPRRRIALHPKASATD